MTSHTGERQVVTPTVGAKALARTTTLIDLSRETYEGMPIWPGHQRPFVMVNQTHQVFRERWGTEIGFEAHNWLMSEHTGTHTDAILEYREDGASVDQMPLAYFYGDAVCLDVSHARHPDYITRSTLDEALASSGLDIRVGDIALLYTGHGERTFPSKEYIERYTGLDRGAAEWLGEKGVVNIGVDAVSIDHSDDLSFAGHVVCGEYQIANTENLTNLNLLVGRRFTFFGLPLKLRRGTGSPIRAVAILHEDQ
jgi:kynurenine formamidase